MPQKVLISTIQPINTLPKKSITIVKMVIAIIKFLGFPCLSTLVNIFGKMPSSDIECNKLDRAIILPMRLVIKIAKRAITNITNPITPKYRCMT